MDFDGVPPSPDRPRQVKCGILVYFEPRSAPKKPPLWLKSKNAKTGLFQIGKNWVFRRKPPKGPTFNKYNINISITKCKDDFSSFSSRNGLFSDSEPLLCRIHKNTPRWSRNVHRFTIFSAVRQNSAKRTNVLDVRTDPLARQDTIIMESAPPVNPTNC